MKSLLAARIANRLRRYATKARAAVASRTFDAADFDGTRDLLWSKGVARLVDVAGAPGYWADGTEEVQHVASIQKAYDGAHGVVWVRLGTRSREGEAVDLDAFADHALSTIERPFVLLTTDGDAAVPSDLRPATVSKLLASPWLRAWYTQNCNVADSSVIRPFPIGLSLHNQRPFGSPRKSAEQLRALALAAKPAGDRPSLIYADIGISLASDDRRRAAQLLPGISHVQWQRFRISQSETWRRYAGCRFVLSLQGNGIDAHRTWEALYLGAIVITLRSTLDALYEGLPVVLVDRLEDVANPKNLPWWSEQYLPLTNREQVWDRLSAAKWMEEVRRVLAGPV